MNYKKFGPDYVLRLDRGEEIVETILKFVRESKLRLGAISGLGACDLVELGIFKVAEQKYYPNRFEGEMEMTSLIGNISEMEGKPYLHLHANFGREDGSVVGGHLNSGRISATAEIFIHGLEGSLDRFHDSELGLNRLAFSEDKEEGK